MPRDDLIVIQDTAPSTPPSRANADQLLGDIVPALILKSDAQGKTLDDNNDPYYHCAAHRFRLCLSMMGNQTSQFLMCINCNDPVHLFCAEYLMEQKPVEDLLYISVKDFTKEGKARWKKTSSSSEKDYVVFCILWTGRLELTKE